MSAVSTFDFSSILNAGKKADPALGSLGSFGGVSDPFASNPYLFSPGATNMAQAGFMGGQLGGSLLGGGLGGGLGGQTDLTQILAGILAQKNALAQYPQLDNTSFKERAEKIEDAPETIDTKAAAERISKAAEGDDKADKKAEDTKDAPTTTKEAAEKIRNTDD